MKQNWVYYHNKKTEEYFRSQSNNSSTSTTLLQIHNETTGWCNQQTIIKGFIDSNIIAKSEFLDRLKTKKPTVHPQKGVPKKRYHMGKHWHKDSEAKELGSKASSLIYDAIQNLNSLSNTNEHMLIKLAKVKLEAARILLNP